MNDDKILVTNRSALELKYGTAGVRRIMTELKALTAADKVRGIVTRLIALDDPAAMKKLKARPVTSVANCSQNKAAIDGVFKALTPDYLVIVGSTDVIPHQDLVNPVLIAGDDGDRIAFSDLPYACDVPYSRVAANFVGPTRVVSRLPDLTGASDPAHLIKLIQFATRAKPRPRSEFLSHFALSAQVWRDSTELSIGNIFGEAAHVRLAPPDGPKFPVRELRARTHFINCHGALADPQFYGQRAESYPISLSSKSLAGAISEGTIAAAECCYGGELYSEQLALELPICQRYLAQGALAYFGSTTIAYGPSSGNGSADLITQFFLISLLKGASVGRAALTARQKYVLQTGQMDAIDLKTLAQFCVYGDASAQAVETRGATSIPSELSAEAGYGLERHERRVKLAQTGQFLKQTKATAGAAARVTRMSKLARAALANIAHEAGVDPEQFVPYKVKAPPSGVRGKALVKAERYHVLVAPSSKRQELPRKVAVVAKEANGRIVGYRVYYSK